MRLALVSSKGGTGKTTSSVFLASALHRQGRTLAIDADPQGSLMAWSAGGDLPFTVVSMPRPDTTAPGTTSIEAKTTACESLQTCCTQTCCLQTWPYYEHSCLRDSRRQGGDAQPVRLIALNGQARHYVSQQ